MTIGGDEKTDIPEAGTKEQVAAALSDIERLGKRGGVEKEVRRHPREARGKQPKRTDTR